MSKEKQIEEMAKDLEDALPDYEHNFRDFLNAAEALYNAGYRKQKELIEENERLKLSLSAITERSESRKEADISEILELRLKVEEVFEMKKYFYNDREITEEEAKRIEAQNLQEEYEPTKNEVFNHLRCSGCTWCGGKGCECYSRTLKECFESAKNDLIHRHKMENKVFVVDDEDKNDAQSVFDEWYKEIFEG